VRIADLLTLTAADGGLDNVASVIETLETLAGTGEPEEDLRRSSRGEER